MPTFPVRTPHAEYLTHVERGLIERCGAFVPAGVSRVFVVTTRDVWKYQGARLERGLAGIDFVPLYLPGGEDQKRLAPLETLACEMVGAGGDRGSVVIAFGGGIVTDMGGFLAAIFMRGIPVIQIPTTLLAQVDAAVGGKTGVNLVNGKNLIGSFHQPMAVLVDPAAVDTLPEREYRAGLYEVIKHGVIASEPLFRMMAARREAVLAREAAEVDEMIRESVRIKAEVVSADERESGLRRILNFGHTFGHALEAETRYKRFLHGEAVAWGMKAAVYLAAGEGLLAEPEEMLRVIRSYGPIPSLEGITVEAIEARLMSDKKTVHGRIHFVLPVRMGEVVVKAGVAEAKVRAAIAQALALA
jgi:3-dehydroquinate synthase